VGIGVGAPRMKVGAVVGIGEGEVEGYDVGMGVGVSATYVGVELGKRVGEKLGRLVGDGVGLAAVYVGDCDDGFTVGVNVEGSEVGESVVGEAVGGGKNVIFSARTKSMGFGARVGLEVLGEDEGLKVGIGRSRFGFPLGFPSSKRRVVADEEQVVYEYGFSTLEFKQADTHGSRQFTQAAGCPFLHMCVFQIFPSHAVVEFTGLVVELLADKYITIQLASVLLVHR
jgi:hypothetical protein